MKHGMSRTPLYVVWKAMHARCRNPNRESWKYYGGRGIKVCERWNDFVNFQNDMGTDYVKGLVLDRYPDGDGDYEPGNTRWTTIKESNRNKRGVIREVNVVALSKASGVDLHTIYQRRLRGWPMERWTEPSDRGKGRRAKA